MKMCLNLILVSFALSVLKTCAERVPHNTEMSATKKQRLAAPAPAAPAPAAPAAPATALTHTTGAAALHTVLMRISYAQDEYEVLKTEIESLKAETDISETAPSFAAKGS